MKRLILSSWFLFILGTASAQQYDWVRVATLGNQFTSLQAVEFVDSVHGWTAEGTNMMFRTTNGGNSWTFSDAAAGFGVSSISMFDTMVGWAVGSQSLSTGKVIHTSDGGVTWSLQQETNSRVYVGTSTITPLNNITSGYVQNSPDTGKILRTSDEGLTWTERPIGDSIQQLTKVQFVDSLHGWILTNGPAGILQTSDGGMTWSLKLTPGVFRTICFIDTLRGWGASGSFQGEVYHTTDGGTSWTFQYCFCGGDSLLRVSALSFIDPLKGWAFGTSVQGDFIGAIHETTDGGLSWHGEHYGQVRHINDGLMLDEHHGWAVGDGGGTVFAYRLATSVAEKIDEAPNSFALRQNFPNPFNPTTSIEYEVLQRSIVDIRVHDINGNEVRQLINSDHEPGVYRIRFDGSGFASGMYYCSMKTHMGNKQFSATRQMILLK